ncbi:MAG: hypothetical protein ABWY27_03705 [Telluria sp.]
MKTRLVRAPAFDLVWIGEPTNNSGVNMTIEPDPKPGQPDSPPESFWRLLYRFIFFDWLFADVRAARNLFERHAAYQHNRRMCRYLPVYLRRWSAMAAFNFGLGFLFERGLQATLLSAWFFTWVCITLTGMAVIMVAWAVLAHARLS